MSASAIAMNKPKRTCSGAHTPHHTQAACTAAIPAAYRRQVARMAGSLTAARSH
ncbi:Uncharacterised protein [Mycobacteroides abscessus subsp. abscessus]|nr:Uncharacterised protein [Mycobacteroides abscessus subsp. abscessus]